MVVPHEEDSFEFNPEEELDIVGDDDGDSDETDDDYVPEGGSGSLGESDGDGGEIHKEGMCTIQRGAGKIHRKGVDKIQKEGAGARQQEGVGKIHKKGVGKIQKEGAGEILKEGVGVTPKEGEGSGLGKGMWGSKRKHSARCQSRPRTVQKAWYNGITKRMKLALQLGIAITARSAHLSVPQGPPA